LNPDLQPAELASSRWTMSPFISVDRMGIEPNAPTLQKSVAPLEHASPFVERSVRELNPAFILTEDACARNTYRPIANQVIADGIEPSLSWMSARRRNRWTTRSTVTRVGVEPTYTRLSTSSLCQFAYLVICKWRVRGSHPTVQAYEARLSAGSPAIVSS
jgi:hypothetical protein